MSFIKFERNLVTLVRERRKSKHIPQKKANIEQAILNRIKILYRQTVHRFPEEVSVWDEYIQFCKIYKFGTEVSAILDRMLQFHADKPETWQKAVMWEHEESKNKERVKHFILGGLQRHPKSDILYFTFFKLKLLEGVTLADETAKATVITQAELIYKEGKENINTVEFIVGMLNIATQFTFARTLEANILDDMRITFPKSEQMWDTLAKRELNGDHLSNMGEMSKAPLDTGKRIELCITTYESACEILNTESMWNYYLNTLLDLNSMESPSSAFTEQSVCGAFKAAMKQDCLNEEYFLKFVELASEHPNLLSKNELMAVLESATKRYPNSVRLWECHMRFHIEYQEVEELHKTFRAALKLIEPKQAFPLWELILLFYKSTGCHNKMVKELYKEVMNLSIPEIGNRMKSDYLEYIYQMDGIAAARQEYNKLSLSVPSSLALHRQMAHIESVQNPVNVHSWRRCHELSTQFFGKENIPVWIEFIRFERVNGDAKRVSALYQRAMNVLDKSLTGDFITEYNVNVTNQP